MRVDCFLEKSCSMHWFLLQERESGTGHPADPLAERTKDISQERAHVMLPGQSITWCLNGLNIEIRDVKNQISNNARKISSGHFLYCKCVLSRLLTAS